MIVDCVGTPGECASRPAVVLKTRCSKPLKIDRNELFFALINARIEVDGLVNRPPLEALLFLLRGGRVVLNRPSLFRLVFYPELLRCYPSLRVCHYVPPSLPPEEYVARGRAHEGVSMFGVLGPVGLFMLGTHDAYRRGEYLPPEYVEYAKYAEAAIQKGRIELIRDANLEICREYA